MPTDDHMSDDELALGAVLGRVLTEDARRMPSPSGDLRRRALEPRGPRGRWWVAVAAAAAALVIVTSAVALSRRDESSLHTVTTPPSVGPTTSSAPSTTSTTVPAIAAPTAWKITPKRDTGSNGSTAWTADHFTVTADGQRTSVAATIENTLNAIVNQAVADSPTDERGVDYSVEGDRYASVVLTETTYILGGTHPTSSVTAKTFDVRTGDVVAPLTLFRSSDAGLIAIRDAVRRRLLPLVGEPNDPNDTTWNRATWSINPAQLPFSDATPDNYRSLVPRSDGLLVRFDQGQVGTSADWLIDVLVPWPDLDAVLAPGAIPDEWRSPARYGTGHFMASLDGLDPLPPELGPLDDPLEVVMYVSGANLTWVFGTVPDSKDVVVLRQDPATAPLWTLDARGPWPISCGSLPAQLLASQGLDC